MSLHNYTKALILDELYSYIAKRKANCRYASADTRNLEDRIRSLETLLGHIDKLTKDELIQALVTHREKVEALYPRTGILVGKADHVRILTLMQNCEEHLKTQRQRAQLAFI